MNKKTLLLLGLVAVILSVFGCSGGGPTTQMITGTIVFEGKPVDDAVVGLSPKGGEGLPAYGRTNANGEFKMTSVQGGRDNAGAVEGDYIVTITKIVPSREPTAEEIRNLQEREIPYNIPDKNLLPEKYANVSTSDLSAKVVQGKNSFRFELVP